MPPRVPFDPAPGSAWHLVGEINSLMAVSSERPAPAGEPLKRICISKKCGWIGDESECLDYKVEAAMTIWDAVEQAKQFFKRLEALGVTQE